MALVEGPQIATGRPRAPAGGHMSRRISRPGAEKRRDGPRLVVKIFFPFSVRRCRSDASLERFS